MRLPHTLGGWALAAVAAVWSLFVGSVVVAFLTAWAAQHHWFDNPDKTVSALAAALVGMAQNPFVIWPVALVLGLTAGFAAGVWLDALLRRKSLPAPLVARHKTLMERAEENRAQVNSTAAQPPAPAPQPAAKPVAAAKPPGPKLGTWEHVDRFKVSEAANLWENYLPGGSYIIDQVQKPSVLGAERLIVSELHDVLDRRDVPSFAMPGDLSNAYVYRKDLLALAERLKVRPVFLYPNG
jgi:hypothetical protein